MWTSRREQWQAAGAVLVIIVFIAGVVMFGMAAAEHSEARRAANRAHRAAHKCKVVDRRGGECRGQLVGKVYRACFRRTPHEVLEECDDGRRWMPAED